VFFLAEASTVHFTLGQEVRLLRFAWWRRTSGAGEPGGAFVKVAAVLSVIPDIPVAFLALPWAWTSE
jgi:aerobic C4-dicarboxylate transport protein